MSGVSDCPLHQVLVLLFLLPREGSKQKSFLTVSQEPLKADVWKKQTFIRITVQMFLKKLWTEKDKNENLKWHVFDQNYTSL